MFLVSTAVIPKNFADTNEQTTMLISFIRLLILSGLYLLVGFVAVCQRPTQLHTTNIPIAIEDLQKGQHMVFCESSATTSRFAFFCSEGKITGLVLDTNLKLQLRTELKLDKKYRLGDLLGYFRKGTDIILVGRTTDHVDYFTIAYDPTKGKFTPGGTFGELVTGQLVTGLSFPDKYVILTVEDGTSRINLNVFTSGSEVTQATVDLSTWVAGLSFTEMLQENKAPGATMYPYYGAANVIEKDVTNDFRATKRRLKIYSHDGHVIFSLDHARGTNLAIVKVADLSVRVNEFRIIPLSQTASGVVKQSSVVYGSSIYMVAVSDQEVAVRVANIYEGKVLNLYLGDAETGVSWARTPFLKYTIRPYKKEEIAIKDYLALVNDPNNFQVGLSAIRESTEGIELAIGLNYGDPQLGQDITGLFKTRLSLDGSVLMAGVPNETAADEAIGYQKLILEPWAMSVAKVSDEIWVGTYNKESQEYVISAWPLLMGSAN